MSKSDKELEELLKKMNNTPSSGWVSSRNDKGESEWKHYRFYDTSNDEGFNNLLLKMFGIGLVIGLICHWLGFV